MGIEISAPVAGAGGAIMLGGGGYLAYTGGRQLQAATSLSQFATPSQVVPSLRDLNAMLASTDELLTGVQSAMQGARLPGTGLFAKVPFAGRFADDLERAVRIGAGAKELAKIDETAMLGTARTLTERSSQLVTAAEADIVQMGVAKTNAMSAGTKLLIGGAIAAAGVLLLATSIFDVE